MLIGIGLVTFGVVLILEQLIWMKLPAPAGTFLMLLGAIVIVPGILLIRRDAKRGSSQKNPGKICTGCGINLLPSCTRCPSCGLECEALAIEPSGTRTTLSARFYSDWQHASDTAEHFLRAEGFQPVEIHGERCWKKGTGLMTAMQFVKLSYTEQELLVEGWIQSGIGSVGGKEQPLDGLVGAIPKKKLRGRLEALVTAVGAPAAGLAGQL